MVMLAHFLYTENPLEARFKHLLLRSRRLEHTEEVRLALLSWSMISVIFCGVWSSPEESNMSRFAAY